MRQLTFDQARSTAPARCARSLTAALVVLCAAGACSPPPALPSTRLSFNLLPVIDRTVLKFVRSFDLRVFDASLNGGQTALTCDDFPTTYSVDDKKLRQHVRKQQAWQGKQEALEVELRVPANRRLVFVVLGLGQSASGSHIILRGCKDNQSFDEGSEEPLEIDAVATLGAACTTDDDCERGLTCLTGSTFSGGYCTKKGCTADAQCPPGGKCIRGGSSGSLCARSCVNKSDCQPRTVYDCLSRTPVAGKCTSTCLYPTFSAKDSCATE